LWADPDTPNRERKRLLELMVEDATLVKVPAQGITHIHVRFKGGMTKSMATLNPRPSGVKTQSTVIEIVDSLLNEYTHAQIAQQLNEQNLRPGGSLRAGRSACRFTGERVSYIVHRYGLRSRLDRLRERGMLTKKEAAARLDIHTQTLIRWAKHGLVIRHALNAREFLYDLTQSSLPAKHRSRWDRLTDRPPAAKTVGESKP
ncbi:MAG: recombinase family protein, partial [Burkholderiaceae bacterium]